MSHYNAIVLIDKDTDPKAEVDRIIAPYFSDREPGEYPRIWDWWRIGGRWDGALLADRETWMKDQCAICAGNGPNAIHHHYTDAHEQPDRNVVEVAQLPEDCHIYSLWADGEFITQNMWHNCPTCELYFSDDEGTAMPYEKWSEHSKTHPSDEPAETWIPRLRQFLVEHGQGKLAVCVDYHN